MFSRQLSEMQINNLNESELHILKYINFNQEKVAQMKIRDLSEAVSYSTATIMRFSKKLGFSGFSELKFEIKKNLEEKKPTNVLHDSHQRLNTMKKDVLNTINLVDPDYLHQLAQRIIKAPKIHLFGTGISGVVISYFERMLFSIGIFHVYRYESSKLINHAILGMEENEIVIVTSASGEFAPTINTVKLAKIENVEVLALTPYTKNEIAQNAKYNLHFFGDLRENKGAEYTTRLPVFYLIHLLINSIIQQTHQKENI